MKVQNCKSCKNDHPEDEYIKKLTSCSDSRVAKAEANKKKEKKSKVDLLAKAFGKLNDEDKAKFKNEIK